MPPGLRLRAVAGGIRSDPVRRPRRRERERGGQVLRHLQCRAGDGVRPARRQRPEPPAEDPRGETGYGRGPRTAPRGNPPTADGRAPAAPVLAPGPGAVRTRVLPRESEAVRADRRAEGREG